MVAMFQGHWRLEGGPPNAALWDLQRQEVEEGLPASEPYLAPDSEDRRRGDTSRPQLEIQRSNWNHVRA